MLGFFEGAPFGMFYASFFLFCELSLADFSTLLLDGLILKSLDYCATGEGAYTPAGRLTCGANSLAGVLFISRKKSFFFYC